MHHLQHTKQSAVVTYDPGILSKDFVFAQFIEGEAGVFVIEDADTFLGSRDDGNDVMHKFLNVGDGLVTTKNKKMIFSTNLPSIHDIDPALLRPGRCFDIVNFNLLNTEQAIALAKKLDVEFDRNDSGQYSIAEVFNKQSQSMKKPRRSVGFV
jgi:SpoVK/Ycf46/Vps4 family AAA+-type ATPase